MTNFGQLGFPVSPENDFIFKPHRVMQLSSHNIRLVSTSETHTLVVGGGGGSAG